MWLLDVESHSATALTATAQNERDPDFSADGDSVIFASDRTGHYCLWSLALATRVETQLTEEPGQASFPTAVHGGGPVAYLLERDGQSSLRLLGANGAATTLLTTTNRLTAPSWRPGGEVLSYGERDASRATRLRIALLTDPLVIKPLSDAEDIFAGRAAWLSEAEFLYAADGRLWRREVAGHERRAVPLFAAAAVEARPPPANLGPLDPDTAQAALGINGLVHSPDGKRAAFTALGDLWLVERGKPQRLTDDPFVDLDPTFSPDGESLVFASERSGGFELWRLTLRDRKLTQLTSSGAPVRAPALSADGRELVYLETYGIGPRSKARLRWLDLGRHAEPVTLADGLLPIGKPFWQPGRHAVTLRVRAHAAMAADAHSVGPAVELATMLETSAGNADDDPSTASEPPAEPTWTVERSHDEYVVQVGRLFDGVRAEYRRHVDIHVVDGRITAIVGRNLLPTPTTVIDARDATVIPGLIDLHAHESALAGERLGRAWLAYGVTTVREIAADPREALERGEAWASGRTPGPRLVITPAAGAAAQSETLRSSTAVPIRAYPGIADGFAHSLLQETRDLGLPRDAAISRSPWLDIVSAGAPYELEVSPAYISYQDVLSRLIASGTVLTPALGAVRGLGDWPDSLVRAGVRDSAYRALYDAAEQGQWGRVGAQADGVPALASTVARLIRAGGHVAVGTDAPTVPYGLGVHYELALLAQAGIPNDQILRIATAEGALALGLERQIGTVEEGKLADFVVINGDPLTRLGDTLKIVGVAKAGVWFERRALLESP